MDLNPLKKYEEDYSLKVGDRVVVKGYEAELVYYSPNIAGNKWIVLYDDGSTAIVDACRVRKPLPKWAY